MNIGIYTLSCFVPNVVSHYIPRRHKKYRFCVYHFVTHMRLHVSIVKTLFSMHHHNVQIYGDLLELIIIVPNLFFLWQFADNNDSLEFVQRDVPILFPNNIYNYHLLLIQLANYISKFLPTHMAILCVIWFPWIVFWVNLGPTLVPVV